MAEQWEYCRISLNHLASEWKVIGASANVGKTYDLPGRAEPVDTVLETLGKEGWELAGIFGDSTDRPQMVFKRRKA